MQECLTLYPKVHIKKVNIFYHHLVQLIHHLCNALFLVFHALQICIRLIRIYNDNIYFDLIVILKTCQCSTTQNN